MDIGNLAMPISFPGFDMFDRVEQAMARLNRLEQPIHVTIDDRLAQQQITQVQSQLQRVNNMTARAKIDVDTTQAESKIDSVLNKLSKGALQGAGALIGIEITKGLGAAADAVIGFNSQLELSKVAFTQLLGSASAADTYLKQLLDFGKATPFATEDVIQYAQRLTAVGVAAKDVIPTLTALGDAVAATGGSTETLNRVVLAIGQIKNSSHLAAQDANQLIQANIPVWDILAQKMGKTQAEVRKMSENGEISGADAAKAIIEGAEQRFGGLMDAQAKTFQGRLSNFKDTAKIELAQIGSQNFGDVGGILDKASDALASPKFKQFATDMANDLHNLTVAAEAVAGALSKIPLPVIEAAIHVGELAVGIKAFGAAVEFSKGILEPLIALTTAETVATAADTAATEANTAAVLANNTARAQGGGLLGKASAVGGGLLAAGGPAIGIAEALKTYPRVISDLMNGDPKQAFGDFIKNAPGTPTGAISLITGALGIGNPLNKLPFWRQNTPAATQPGTPTPLPNPAQAAVEVSAATQKENDDAAKAFAENMAAYQKQMYQDIAASAKQGAEDVANAWKAAGAEVAKIDVRKSGLSSLADASEPLHQAVTDLANLGKSNASLSSLSSLSDRFKALADQEKAASAALDGYNLTLGDTDKRLQQVDSIKRGFLEAVDAAEQARLRGVATQAQLDLIANKDGALAKLDNARVQLTGNAAQDWSKIIQNLPDWVQADLNERGAVASAGGGKQLLLSVEAQTEKAKADIHAIEINPWATTMTVHLQYVTPDGKSIDPSQIDNPGGGGFANGGQGPGGAAAGLPLLWPPGVSNATRGYGDNGIPTSTTPAAANGYNAYRPLDQSSYTAIVRNGAGGPGSPFEDPAIYASVLKAAQDYGVDPRALLAFTKNENNNARNISVDLNMANNFGGIKFAGQAGATRGPASPEGDAYAAFADPADFFRALARNLTQGDYAGDYAAGNLEGVRRRYVTGGGPGSADQEANIRNTVADYQRYLQQYPSPGGGAGGYLPGYGPGDTALGSSQIPTGGALNVGPGSGVGSSAIYADAQKHIGDQKDRFARDVYGWCLEVTQDILQETGFDERGKHPEFSHTADERVRAAMSGMPGAGTVVPQSQARAGDIVGWLGTSAYAGDPAGHIGVYEGNGPNGSAGNYIGTTKQGVQERPIGPDAVFIRPDGVVAGGPVPGSVLYSGASARAATGYGPGTYNSTGGTQPAPPNSGQSDQELAAAAAHVYEKQAVLYNTMGKLGAKDFSATISQFNSLAPILDKMAHAGDTDTTSPTKKLEESQQALAKNLSLTNLWGQALSAITNKTGDLASIEKEISATIGGPIARDLSVELNSYQTIAQTADRITQLTQRKTDLEASHTALLAQRQQADTAESRAQTRQGWADQDADTKLANRTRAENAGYTTTQRGFEDRARALAFSQQVQATDLQNKLTDLQKTQQSTVWQRTSQEQLVSAQAAGASTNQGQGVLSARLAALHEQDLAQKDLNTKAIDDIQLQIREQAKQSNLESYNLQTETIAAQRKHEDILAGIDAEGVANAANRQARDRSHQVDLWNIEDERLKEDTKYTLAQGYLDKEILAQQALATQADANLKAAQDALNIYQQTGIDIGLAGTALDTAAQKLVIAAQQAAYYANVAGLKTPTGVPYNQFPAPGASHYAGGTDYAASGWAMVGEKGPEWVRFRGGETVKPNGVKPVAPAAPASSGGGDTALHMHFEGGAASLSDEDLVDIQRYVNNKVGEAERRMKQSGRKHKAATGVN